MTNAKTESAVCLLAKSVSGNNKKKGEQNQAGSDDRLGNLRTPSILAVRFRDNSGVKRSAQEESLTGRAKLTEKILKTTLSHRQDRSRNALISCMFLGFFPETFYGRLIPNVEYERCGESLLESSFPLAIGSRFGNCPIPKWIVATRMPTEFGMTTRKPFIFESDCR